MFDSNMDAIFCGLGFQIETLVKIMFKITNPPTTQQASALQKISQVTALELLKTKFDLKCV